MADDFNSGNNGNQGNGNPGPQGYGNPGYGASGPQQYGNPGYGSQGPQQYGNPGYGSQGPNGYGGAPYNQKPPKQKKPVYKKVWFWILIIFLLIIIISAASSGGSDSKKSASVDTSSESSTNDVTTDDTASNEDSTQQDQTLKIGDTWTVDGQWNLTIDSVQSTEERNPYSDVSPEQVVIVTYSYENLGYKSDIMDGLYMDLEPNGDSTCIDATGEMAVSYPANISKYPQETPVGAKCTGAQACVGLMHSSDSFTMNIKKYDGNGKAQSVTYELKVD